MQEEIQDIIKGIKTKVQKLQVEKENLQKENAVLKEKLQISLSKEEKQQKKIVELQQQAQALQVGSNNLSVEEKKKLEKVIDKHIQAIDKSIALLSE